MKQLELLHEGKSKLIYATDSAERIVVRFKDDATAFYNIKRAKIQNKARMPGIVIGWLQNVLSNKANHLLRYKYPTTQQ